MVLPEHSMISAPKFLLMERWLLYALLKKESRPDDGLRANN